MTGTGVKRSSAEPITNDMNDMNRSETELGGANDE